MIKSFGDGSLTVLYCTKHDANSKSEGLVPMWPISIYFAFTVFDLGEQSTEGCHPYSNLQLPFGNHIRDMIE